MQFGRLFRRIRRGGAAIGKEQREEQRFQHIAERLRGGRLRRSIVFIIPCGMGFANPIALPYVRCTGTIDTALRGLRAAAHIAD